jgi:hypothetical protein
LPKSSLQKSSSVCDGLQTLHICSFVFEVSAGFDAAEGDPLGECNVTPSGFAHMTKELCTLADGRVVVVLEVKGSPVTEMYPH